MTKWTQAFFGCDALCIPPFPCIMAAMPDFTTICEKAARAGGAVLLGKMGQVSVREKGPADLVTDADLASQAAVRDVVLGAFPDHSLLGEEDPPCPDDQGAASGYRWLVDPLDGTTNYVHGVPHFAVSVALEHAGELLAAAVFDPVLDQCYTAAPGTGAWVKGRPPAPLGPRRIRTSSVTSLSQAIGAVSFPSLVRDDSPDLKVFLQAVKRCQSLRRTGSAALNLCDVAAGRFDAFWSFSTRIWDMAAGALLVREAGGVVTAPDGGPIRLHTGQFLAAANEPLHREVLELVAGAGLL